MLENKVDKSNDFLLRKRLMFSKFRWMSLPFVHKERKKEHLAESLFLPKYSLGSSIVLVFFFFFWVVHRAYYVVHRIIVTSRCPARCAETLYFYFEIISNYSLWPYNTHLMFNYNIHIIKRKKIKRNKIIMNIHCSLLDPLKHNQINLVN